MRSRQKELPFSLALYLSQELKHTVSKHHSVSKKAEKGNQEAPDLCIEHVDAEVAEGSLEEILLGAVLQQGTVHCAGAHLETNQEKGERLKSSCRFKLALGWPQFSV